MQNGLIHMLRQWYPIRDEARWVLAAVIRTEGSVYRKAGALMLISDASHQLGLISGGCLEADIHLQAMRVLGLGGSRKVRYDARDEGSLAWRLGIGCGGAAEVLLHPCNADNEYLALCQLMHHLEDRQKGTYCLSLEKPHAKLLPEGGACDEDCLGVPLQLPVHLLVFGGGADMQPLTDIAARLGWLITVVDKRPANAQSKRFPAARSVIACAASELSTDYRLNIDAAIVATHSLSMDAEAIAWLQASSARYIGLLGPVSRRRQVLAAAGIQEGDLDGRLAGPVGLDLGGDLPESIALAALAECHAALFGKSGRSLSGALASSGGT